MPVFQKLSDRTSKQRTAEMATSTWKAIQNGNGKVRRVRRCIITYIDTNVRNLRTIQVPEALVSIGLGIGVSILSSAVLAAGVGTFGALPISIALGILLSILAKKIFDAIKAAQAKNLALKIANSNPSDLPQPEVKDDEIAEALIGEVFKDTKKVVELMTKIVEDNKKWNTVFPGQNDYRNVTDINAFKQSPELYFPEQNAKLGQLHRSGGEGALYKPHIEVASRLLRLKKYKIWLDKYFNVLKLAIGDFRADEFVRLEDWVVKTVETQVSAHGNHRACPDDFCYGPDAEDLQKVPLSDNEKQQARVLYSDILENSKSFQSQNQMLSQLKATRNPVQVQNDDDDPSPLKKLDDGLNKMTESWDRMGPNFKITREEVRKKLLTEVVKSPQTFGTNTDIGGSNLISQHISQQMGDKFHHVLFGVSQDTAGQMGVAAVGSLAMSSFMAPISFLIGKAIGQYFYSRDINRPVMNHVGKLRKMMHYGNTEELEKELKKVWDGKINQKQAVRAMTMCSRHYPERVKDRLDKLKTLLEKLNLVTVQARSPYGNCPEAQKAMRYLLKVHHNAEKHLVHLALLEMVIDEVYNKHPHYQVPVN